jgi:hypothetical protein
VLEVVVMMGCSGSHPQYTPSTVEFLTDPSEICSDEKDNGNDNDDGIDIGNNFI